VTSSTIDINSDLGESLGRWTLGDDSGMVRVVTSANLACGFHAGDFSVMDQAVALCKEAGVGVGAQPGYPDIQGFGRRPMALSEEEIAQLVLYQVGALYGFCRAHQVELQHVKPHGALYNQAVVDPQVARGVARGVARFSRAIPLLGLAGSRAFAEAAADEGLRFVPEAFGDRRYNADGTLQSRSEPGSVLADPAEAAQQALGIAKEGIVVAKDGTRLTVSAASICFHGDTEGAVANATRTRALLEQAGIAVRSFG
jgi:5-oxoprolinase (ATP-hydrolysing) subunit A